MIRISRLALIAVAAAGIASPALAQSFDPDVGTGTIVPFSVGPATASVTKVAVHKIRHRTVAARQSGAIEAFSSTRSAGCLMCSKPWRMRSSAKAKIACSA